ncbi:MAG: hypothetical protein HY822_23375 [Acidobacteria bacterium]|nr:hypothetical protein [Acidobacteriota bacterium]
MKAFRFPLERVMQWRKAQLELEELRLHRLLEQARAVAAAIGALEAAVTESGEGLRRQGSVAGSDLNTLCQFRQSAARRRERLLAEALECERAVERQRKQVRETQRAFRLLEKLKQERQREWSLGLDRELEALAGECHLARWVRENRPASE